MPRRQRGSTAVEFILTGIPILLVGLGAVELSRWFFIKQAISLALLEAGRAGIVDHARPASIEAAFERALLPLFPSTSTQSAMQRLRQAFERRQIDTGAPPWQITVISPNAAVFRDFSAPGLAVPGAAGLAVIDNNYQAEQHQRYAQRGWPEGRGPSSGVNIFEANELTLHLTYMHEPLVPGIGAMLRLLSAGSSGYARQALAGGYLPLQQSLRLAMQSHPVAWHYTGPKVVAPGASPPEVPGESAGCRGPWCDDALDTHAPEDPTSPVEAPWVPSGPPGDPSGDAPPTPTPPGNPPDAPETPDPPPGDDIACGTVLCCLEG